MPITVFTPQKYAGYWYVIKVDHGKWDLVGLAPELPRSLKVCRKDAASSTTSNQQPQTPPQAR